MVLDQLFTVQNLAAAAGRWLAGSH